MKNLLFIAAAILFSNTFCVSAHAEIVKNGNVSSGTISATDLLNDGESIELDEMSEEDSVSVPEPATFGIIVVGLAVGGGLMVRRKD